MTAILLFFAQYRTLIYIGTAMALFGGYTAYVHHKGYAEGHAELVAYQASIEAQSTKVKSEADAKVAQALADNLKLNQRIEADHAQHTAETDALHNQLATVRLRFKSSSGCSQLPSATSSPADATTAYVELPNETSLNLSRLAYDADRLKDDYAACRAWAYGGK